MIKAFDKWLLPYLLRSRRTRSEAPLDLVIAVCDHFEPFHHADKTTAMGRMRHWARAFPKLVGPFRDADDQPPKHTFFYPIEQYDEDIIDALAAICRTTGSEVEIHLHHDGDSEESLAVRLDEGKVNLARHGLLSTNSRNETVYGFIHGDWAIANSHPAGRHCGVTRELGVLRRSGCYADFTMPSAPSPTQARIVNTLYYANDSPQPRSHDRGEPVSTTRPTLRDSTAHLAFVQGPLGLNWRWRKWGLVPRVENGDLTGANPPSASRLATWLDLGIHVHGRPDVVFVKLHTHGAVERNSSMLLGEPMHAFHRMVTADPRFRLHYATAREMVNILHSLEDNRSEPIAGMRDYLYRSNIVSG